MLSGATGRASDCICGKHMLQAENGTCVWCGHGIPRREADVAYRLLSEQPAIRAVSLVSVDARAQKAQTLGARRQWDEDACIQAYVRWEREHGRAPTALDRQAAKNGDGCRPSYQAVKRTFGGWPAFKRAVAEVPREQALAA